MSELGLLELHPQCPAPELNQHLTEYCFGSITGMQRRLFEAHLLDCDFCWDEVQRLSSAVHTMRHDPELAPMFLPADVSTCLGLSARVTGLLGGHTRHVLIAIALYSLLYVCGLLAEVAYAFDRFGRTALLLSPVVFLWVASTAAFGLWWDWRSVVRGTRTGLRNALAVFAISALVLYVGLCFFLPDRPITVMSIQAYTAQAAYMKGIRYDLPLAAVYIVIPFHFIVSMQNELANRRYRLALGVITEQRWAVIPNGAIYIGTRTLWMVILALVLISIPMTSRLFDNLKPGVYMNLFSHFMQARWILYFGLAVESLMWYGRALNDLKRECLLAQGARAFTKK